LGRIQKLQDSLERNGMVENLDYSEKGFEGREENLQ